MPARTGPTNPMLRRLIRQLREHGRKQKAKIWLDIAERLEGPSRIRSEVNLSQLERYASNGDVVVVPGKVLAAGRLSHPISVAAFRFSSPARRKLMMAGGRALTIQELMEQNPTGKGVKLME
ncbi:MAG: 50S ribosomal protein L18e [Hadesarchaea archaeon]|nr:MAG: 50S ribosomal protein L18e [Hadesarchaea archaeon]